MLGKKDGSGDKQNKPDYKEIVKWRGQWDKREESKKRIEEEEKGSKRIEGLTEKEIEQFSYDFVKFVLSKGYNLEKVQESSYGGKIMGERIIAKFNTLDILLIFMSFFPKQAISEAVGKAQKDLRAKLSKKITNPPPLSNEERSAVWNAFLQKYYIDELDKSKNQEKTGWFKSLLDKFKK